ncbi:MAG: HD domain-containing protein [Oscillospiraceae bacterium]|nr:HD domain-containing protein [Oscillospiraceae bacterium]
MILPDYVKYCLQELESAGYPAYAVGGCVRDSLLGNTPHDFDLCTGAKPHEICSVFSHLPLVKNGEKHGTIGVVIDHHLVEITTFRTEGGYQDNRHPDWVNFVSSLDEDLARRDFTVNAMAYSPKEGYIDPFGGREDLENRILRAVGDPGERFTEDSLRILRGVRFAVRFHLTPEENTKDALFRLAPLMDNLARERVFAELCKLLTYVNAQDLLTYAPVITQVIPELAPSVGFRQNSPHHLYDVYTHTAQVTSAMPPEPTLRWAALLHDVAKPQCYTEDENGRGHFKGHAPAGAELADKILQRLKAPNALRERVVFLIGQHMTPFTPDKKVLRRRLGKWGQEATRQLLTLQRADFCSKGTGTAQEERVFADVEACLAEVLEEGSCFTVKDLAVGGNDLLALGMTGKQIGETLETLLAKVQNEELPNEKEALLSAVKER